ncbi:MAG TPA: hypothetical protein VF559_00795 [Caulobacteraceae bacterium]|jgi:hypothetical protein
MSVRYPIAANAELALNSPLGRAAREREAQALAGEAVEFLRELSGPAFDTPEAALALYAGKVDGDGALLSPEDRYCELIEVVAPAAGRPRATGQAEPVFAGGRRWPEPKSRLQTAWRLSVGYWRPLRHRPHHDTPVEQARQVRRSQAAERLDPAVLRRIAGQPLKPVKPQQPLDIGLFEQRLPENPDIVIPDE